MSELVLNMIDYEGNRVVFTKKQYDKKRAKRPDLDDPSFMRRISEAIEQPRFVYRDVKLYGTRRAHYLIEYESHTEHGALMKTQYTKVMVDLSARPFEVITAYRPDYVKERGKTQLLFGQDPYAQM